MATRKVYFHQLTAYKKLIAPLKGGKEVYTTRYLTIRQLDEKFMYIIHNELNENKCLQLNSEGETLEYIDHDDKFIFAILGKAADIRNYHLRNISTLKAEEIKKSNDQNLEVFTYVLISRDTYVLTYLKQQSSPSIQTIGSLITDIFYDEHKIEGKINSITVEDALPLLSKKEQIGTISYRMSLPPEGSEYFTSELTGLSESDYDLLNNQKGFQIDIKLKAERNKDAFDTDEDRTGFKKIVTKLLEKASFVKIKAKNQDERMQEYNIVDSPFTKYADFNLESFDRDEVRKEIFAKMRKQYIAEEEEIVKLCRIEE